MSRRFFAGSAIAASLAVLPALLLADGPIVCPAIDHPAPISTSASAPGIRAAIDPATGALRTPTAEERMAASARKRAARAETMRNLEVVVHPNGMKTVDLGDAFLFDVVVETAPDGTIGYRCVPGAAQAPAAASKEVR